MIPTEVARRYARALFELGLENQNLDALTRELSDAASAYESSAELRSALDNPLVALDAKRAILTDLAQAIGAGPTAKHTLLMLGDRRRVKALPDIARGLRELADGQRGVQRADVMSAHPLSPETADKLRAELERITGRRIALEVRVDASLLAGVIARIGDTIYDGSLRGRMATLKNNLLPN
jgi:F-type H+-transporting ATPase subunit delta